MAATINGQDNTALQETETLTMSERFTNKVLQEFGSNVAGEIQVTDFQKQLIQGYFIGIDRALKKAEADRIRKNKNNSDRKYDNNLPVIWANVNLNALALDIIHYARMGLDMMQDNHIAPTPYKNKNTNQYDLTLIPGYNGLRYIAERYAAEPPLAVTTALVYSTDTFKPVMKSRNNKVEGYDFEINNAFDRGEIVGGFGYIEYDDPVKNRLIMMTLKDILKRKPEYAAPEFWGGKAKRWRGGKLVEVEMDGWFEEMCLKTVIRNVYSARHIPRDPEKVDAAYQHMKMREARYAEIEAQAEIDEHANAITIDTTPEALPLNVDTDTGEILGATEPRPEPKPDPVPAQTQQPTATAPNTEAAVAGAAPAETEAESWPAGPDF